MRLRLKNKTIQMFLFLYIDGIGEEKIDKWKSIPPSSHQQQGDYSKGSSRYNNNKRKSFLLVFPLVIRPVERNMKDFYNNLVVMWTFRWALNVQKSFAHDDTYKSSRFSRKSFKFLNILPRAHTHSHTQQPLWIIWREKKRKWPVKYLFTFIRFHHHHRPKSMKFNKKNKNKSIFFFFFSFSRQKK